MIPSFAFRGVFSASSFDGTGDYAHDIEFWKDSIEHRKMPSGKWQPHNSEIREEVC